MYLAAVPIYRQSAMIRLTAALHMRMASTEVSVAKKRNALFSKK
jgi:hypothetical protein